MMKLKKEFLVILLKLFFSFLWFFVIFFLAFNFNNLKSFYFDDWEYFLNDENFYSAYEEEKISKEAEIILQKRNIEKLKQEIKSRQLVAENTNSMKLSYMDFEENNSNKNVIKEYFDFFELFFNNWVFLDKILDLQINLYQNKSEVRWKLYWKKIHLYEIFTNDKKEIFWVFIHEFAHFIDLYYFPKNILNDISDDFYKISWDWKKLKSWQELKDFVSWYSMTNKYEDFAECFVFYVLFNKEFSNLAKNSEILQNKYDFFTQYLFTKWEFLETSFSLNNNFSHYIRDSTKLDYNLENLLNYLKK